MKNLKGYFFVLFCVAVTFYSCAPGVVRVNARPSVVVGVRPLAPGPRHIWIADEYRWNRGRYVHVPGRWALPPRNNYVSYVPGHWKNTRGGVRWVPGRWR